MTRDTCRRSTCTNPPREDVSGYAGKFCSDECEVKHDHIKADARDAQRERHHDDAPRHDRGGRRL